MPDLGFYHPIVIHFAIGLITGGVLLRWLSLTRRGAFAGRAGDAASLLEIAAQRFPADPAVQVRAAVALLEDRNDPAGALEILGRLGPIPEEPRLRFRRGWLTADALDALGRQPEARAVLERLRVEFPENTRLRGRLARADASPNSNKQP